MMNGDELKLHYNIGKTHIAELYIPTNAFDVTCNGNLEEYFNQIEKCDIQNQTLKVMNDMYNEIKKLRGEN